MAKGERRRGSRQPSATSGAVARMETADFFSSRGAPLAFTCPRRTANKFALTLVSAGGCLWELGTLNVCGGLGLVFWVMVAEPVVMRLLVSTARRSLCEM